MLIRIILKLLVLSAAIYLATELLPDDMIALEGGYKTFIYAAVILSLVNISIKPVLQIISLPLTIITLGLFSFVINALMLYVVAYVVDGFIINSFIGALIGSIVISIISSALSLIVRK